VALLKKLTGDASVNGAGALFRKFDITAAAPKTCAMKNKGDSA
jgi:hypothetical protein